MSGLNYHPSQLVIGQMHSALGEAGALVNH